jgi:two-component system, OmpR family, aerobic respiration control sensor histidine kinase ArcB
MPTYKGQYSGAGLGLTLVKQMLGAIGGKIQVRSKPGQGSEFIFYMPFKKIKASEHIDDTIHRSPEFKLQEEIFKEGFQSVQPAPISKSPGAEQKKRRILLVEDNIIAQKATLCTLSNFNYDVKIVTTGEDALEKIQNDTFDLIYMDIGLPGIDGYQTTQRIRDWEKKQQLDYTPIIALTAHIDKDNKQACFFAGINEVVTKPLTIKNIQYHIDDYILKKSNSPLV